MWTERSIHKWITTTRLQLSTTTFQALLPFFRVNTKCVFKSYPWGLPHFQNRGPGGAHEEHCEFSACFFGLPQPATLPSRLGRTLRRAVACRRSRFWNPGPQDLHLLPSAYDSVAPIAISRLPIVSLPRTRPRTSSEWQGQDAKPRSSARSVLHPVRANSQRF